MALAALVVLGASLPASSSSSDPRAEQPPGPGTSRPADVGDPHQRIDRIIQQLGIKEAADEPRGCGYRKRPEEKQQPGAVPRLQVPSFLGYLLLGVLFAAMLVPLILALRSGYREVPDSGGDQQPDEALPSDSDGPRAPWRVDLSDCQRLLAAGQLAAAFAALHRLTLLGLQQRGHLTLDESTTNWAYVRRLASKPSLRRMLAQVTEAAERSVLSRRTPDIGRYRELERQVLEGIE